MISGSVAVTLDTLCEIELPTGEAVPVVRRRFGGGEGPRVVFVAGLGGDTPEGTRLLHVVGKFLASCAEELRGTVELYPCLNPLAAHLGVRAWPGLDVDLSRRFPGREDSHAPDRVAAAFVAAVEGAAQVVELRGAHPAFRLAPQARVRAERPLARERAELLNVRCVRLESGVLPGSLESCVPDLVVLQGGAGNRLTEGVSLELGDGLLNLLSHLGVLPEARLPFHWAAIQRPIVAGDDAFEDVRTDRGGLFLPAVGGWGEVQAGDLLGEVIEPISGEVREELRAPRDGRVLALREEPVVYPGNLAARLVCA